MRDPFWCKWVGIPVTLAMLKQLVMTDRLGGPNCLDCTDAGDKRLRMQAKTIGQAFCIREAK